MDFYIVDVFAQEKYSGNQLAVFRDAAAISADNMQAIAREMHFSETTFILSNQQKHGGYDVRIFTPRREIPFAGHPTLGTAYVLREEIIRRPVDRVVLNLEAGPIPVSFSHSGTSGRLAWMRQNRPEFGQVLQAEQLSRVLGLGIEEIDNEFPIQEVSTGLPTIIVPVKGLKALRKTRINQDQYWQLIESTWGKLILVFSREGYSDEHDLSVRVFADYYGVPEDPATGSGNGCLAGYLVKHRYLGGDSIDLRVGQGNEVDRPSLLMLKASQDDEGIRVMVGGAVIKVAQGRFL